MVVILIWCAAFGVGVHQARRVLRPVPLVYYPREGKACRGGYHLDEMRASPGRPVLGPQRKPVCHNDLDPRTRAELPENLACNLVK